MNVIERLEERRLLAVDDYGLVPQGSASATPADVPTYVLVHGWNGSPALSWGFGTIGSALEQRIGNGAQVYAFDWSEAAGTGGDFFTAEARIPDAGQGLADLLSGVSASNIHLIGHSFGAFVANVAAKSIGRIASITALDPGIDVPGGYNASSDVNFAARAEQSWAISGSGFSQASLAATADFSVAVRWAQGSDNDSARHAWFVSMFRDAINGDYAHIPGLDVAYLANGQHADVVRNRFDSAGGNGGSFDAVFLATLDDFTPFGVEYHLDSGRRLDLFARNELDGGAYRALYATAAPDNSAVNMNRAGVETGFRWDAPFDAGVTFYGSSNRDYIDVRGSTVGVSMDGFDGDDILVGTEFRDEIYGGRDRDTIHGLGGDDGLYGQSHADKIFGGDGDDIISGKTGNDYLRGEAGNDKLYGDQGSDWMRGHGGDDILEGGSSNGKLYGDEGNDTLIGGEGRDYLRGYTGYDFADNDPLDAVVQDIEELL